MLRCCRRSLPLRAPNSRRHSGLVASRHPGMTVVDIPLRRGGVLCDRSRISSPHLAAVMKILLLGSGGREHALAWKIAASPLLTKLWCAPGNAGIAKEAECVALDVADHAAVIAFCERNAVDLVVVGPET